MNLFKIMLSVCLVLLGATCAIAQADGEYKALLNTANDFYTKGDWKQAAVAYKKAIADTSTDALLWQRLGVSSQMAGNYSDAMASYKKGLTLKPTFYQQGVMQKGTLEVYDRQNNYNDALAFLQHAVEQGFSNFPVFNSLKIFTAHQSAPEYQAVLSKAKQNAYPCMAEPHNKDFDFWVGDWDVYQTGSTILVGRSKITKLDGDCTIIEDFTSLITPQSGHSINYYDKASGKWEQVYSGTGGGHQLYDQGEYKDGRMAFHFQATFKNTPYDGHFYFYNVDANTVRQVQDFTGDGGKTYQAAYDFTYTRRK